MAASAAAPAAAAAGAPVATAAAAAQGGTTGGRATAQGTASGAPPRGNRGGRAAAAAQAQAIANQAAGSRDIVHIDAADAANLRRSRAGDHVDVIDNMNKALGESITKLTDAMDSMTNCRQQQPQQQQQVPQVQQRVRTQREEVGDVIDRLFNRRKQLTDAGMDTTRVDGLIQQAQDVEDARILSVLNSNVAPPASQAGASN